MTHKMPFRFKKINTKFGIFYPHEIQLSWCSLVCMYDVLEHKMDSGLNKPHETHFHTLSLLLLALHVMSIGCYP